ncbi:MAG: hypothetical protein JSR83_11515 [Proteobacteria bacterium]|nr:hypothetical protein [Pseudomonadota bacterium]
MDNFYDKVPAEQALEIQRVSRLMYEVRAARDDMLARLGAADAEQALACIVDGQLPEHPGYEHYLSVRILNGLHNQVRAELAALVKEAQEQ